MTGQRTTIRHGRGSGGRRRGRLLAFALLLLAGMVVLGAYLASPVVLGRFWEQPAKPTLRIDNRTD
jgi:hypothetical protein